MADDFDTAFPTLTDADMAVLDELGTRRPDGRRASTSSARAT